MNYKLTDIKLRQVDKDAARNAGTFFIQATVVNPDDEWDSDAVLTTFNDRLVNKFRQYIGVSQPGPIDAFGRQTWLPSALLNAANPIPEGLTTFAHGAIEEFVFPGGEMVAVNDDGTPRMNDAGKLIMRSSIMVVTKKTVDNETGEQRYAKGWSLLEQGTSIMNAFYAPKSQFAINQPAGVVLPQSPTAPLTNGGTAPTGAPTAAPTAQPAPGAPQVGAAPAAAMPII